MEKYWMAENRVMGPPANAIPAIEPTAPKVAMPSTHPAMVAPTNKTSNAMRGLVMVAPTAPPTKQPTLAPADPRTSRRP